jgi:hypothetical protein
LLQGGAWENKGIGQLMVRVSKDNPAKPFITFTTEAVSAACTALLVGSQLP